MQLAFKILKITAVSHTSVIPGLGGRGRKIGNSKSSLIHITFKASLGYTMPCFNIIKKLHMRLATNPLDCSEEGIMAMRASQDESSRRNV